MSQNGLKTFYCTDIRSISAYASPVFYNFLSKTCKCRLERVQASATMIVKPDLEYHGRLKVLDLPTLSDFIITASESVFKKIARNEKHPLFNCIGKSLLQKQCLLSRVSIVTEPSFALAAFTYQNVYFYLKRRFLMLPELSVLRCSSSPVKMTSSIYLLIMNSLCDSTSH